MRDYRMYIGKVYPAPHGCLLLVADVLRDVFDHAVPFEVTEQVMQVFRKNMIAVTNPKEGDMVMIKANQWHVGVIVSPGMMIHAAPPIGTVIIERYDGLQWKSRIRGYYTWQ